MNPEARYLWDQLRRHARLFFSPEAFTVLNSREVHFLPYADAISRRGPGIAIPTDLHREHIPDQIFEVPFNGTTLRLWPRLPLPDSDGWTALPGRSAPLWYRHRSGALIPGWDMFGTLFDLMTFQEEHLISERDRHGRFVAGFSPRAKLGVLDEPVFNNAVAVLVGAVLGLQNAGVPLSQISEHIRPVSVVLSHDCDLLRGNDSWTQFIRLYRVVEPVRRLRLPRFQNLWWTLRNAVRPLDYYLGNVAGMVLLEKMFCCHSTFYVLNGTRGRFGARSGSDLVPSLVSMIPEGWEIGIHYNYDTYLCEERFKAQKTELEELTGRKLVCGRAHYLLFDPVRSPTMLQAQGIEVDESAGFSDRVGYRCGIGGCFQPWDETTRTALNLIEIPMTVMDGTLLRQSGEQSVAAYEKMMFKLSRVGGALTLVFHPGQFFNPEFAASRHLFHGCLQVGRALGTVSETSQALAERFRKPLSPSGTDVSL